jgi:hypothetical protein
MSYAQSDSRFFLAARNRKRLACSVTAGATLFASGVLLLG